MPKLECEEVKPLLFAYSRDGLSVKKAKKVEGHLGVCPDCARSYRSMIEGMSMIEPTRPAKALVPQPRPSVLPPRRSSVPPITLGQKTSASASPQGASESMGVRRTRKHPGGEWEPGKR